MHSFFAPNERISLQSLLRLHRCKRKCNTYLLQVRLELEKEKQQLRKLGFHGFDPCHGYITILLLPVLTCYIIHEHRPNTLDKGPRLISFAEHIYVKVSLLNPSTISMSHVSIMSLFLQRKNLDIWKVDILFAVTPPI